MKVIMVMVMSVDGKITKGDDPDITNWTSKEDQKYFSFLVEDNNLIVVGSNTYEAIKNKVKLHEGKLRIVLTSHPETYKKDVVLGQLEFTNETPRQLIARLRQKNYKQMLLLGGGAINASFVAENLVNELYLTVEPKIFGQGKPIVTNVRLDTQLKLAAIKKINVQGTLLLKYKIL